MLAAAAACSGSEGPSDAGGSARAEAESAGIDGSAAPVAATDATAGSGARVERQTLLMGTTLTVRAEAADRETTIRAAEAAFDEVARLEGLISSWDGATALSRLNRAPAGDPVPVDAELLAMLVRAERLSDATGGAFEPAVGPLVDAWDLRGEGRTPDETELARALEAVRAGFALDTARGTATRRHPAAWIDAGGFGKGAALAAAAEATLRAGARRALLDFGGQALTLGPLERSSAPEARSWRIGVAHPSRRGEPVAVLRVGPGLSVATSGSSERPGHLLDPRTGRPVPAWGSVTVVSPDPLVADALSTALYVLGPDGALAWATSRREQGSLPDLDILGVLVLEDAPTGPRARWSRSMTQWLDTTSIRTERNP